MSEWRKNMSSNPDFQAWADKKGLTTKERALAWEAWQEVQEAIRRGIRESGDIPPPRW